MQGFRLDGGTLWYSSPIPPSAFPGGGARRDSERPTMRGHAGLHSLITSTDEKPQITRQLLWRVFQYARPYRLHIAAMLLLILLSTGLNLVTPLVMRELIDHTLPARDLRRLLFLSAALLILPMVGGLVQVVQRRLNSRVGEGVIYDLRMALYSGLQRMSLRFFTNTRVGELMSRLNNDVVGAQNAISNTIVGIVTDIIQSAAILSVMLALEWRLTLVSVIILPLFILAARLMGRRLRNIARRQLEANARMNAVANETLNIGGALLVKLFGRQQLEVQRFGERASRVQQLGIQRAVTGSLFFAIVGLISAVGTALVYGLGGYFVIQGAFTVGTIVAFGAYLGGLYNSLQGLANAPVEFATSMVSFERVFEVIDLPVEIPQDPAAVHLDEVRGHITFEDVTFQYPPRAEQPLSGVRRYGSMDAVEAVLSGAGQAPTEPAAAPRRSQARRYALQNIHFEVQPGQLAAIVGPSGAGKTTLTYLIPRLYDPTTGCIRIDGQDIRRISLDSLSACIGMVTQETYLFHDTIRTNLLYARLDASQQELEEACRTANIHEFISELPEGYDTVVGERGYRLSGGEKQRLALARVILKDPRILLLDEATSSLDSASETLIQEALRRVLANRTSLVIAHRLSTILAADLILVLDRGRIVERGTHAELLEEGGLYARLYRTQFRRQAQAA